MEAIYNSARSSAHIAPGGARSSGCMRSLSTRLTHLLIVIKKINHSCLFHTVLSQEHYVFIIDVALFLVNVFVFH